MSLSSEDWLGVFKPLKPWPINIHSKRTLHCDIRQDDLLRDAKLDLKLADF